MVHPQLAVRLRPYKWPVGTLRPLTFRTLWSMRTTSRQQPQERFDHGRRQQPQGHITSLYIYIYVYIVWLRCICMYIYIYIHMWLNPQHFLTIRLHIFNYCFSCRITYVWWWSFTYIHVSISIYGGCPKYLFPDSPQSLSQSRSNRGTTVSNRGRVCPSLIRSYT